MARKSKRLVDLSKELKENGIAIDDLDADTLIELKEQFDLLNDNRDPSYTKHILSDIVVLTLLAVLSNADEWTEIEMFGICKEEWLRNFLELPYGIPSHDTIQRVIGIIRPEQLNNVCVSFLINKLDKMFQIVNDEEEQEEEQDILSFDGKEARGSKRKKTDKEDVKALRSLNVYSNKYRINLAQVFIDDKSNEIPAMLDILDMVKVKGVICTFDALNTQKKTVEKIILGKGEYVGALKGNQHNFYNDVVLFFNDEEKEEIRKSNNYKKTVEKEHSAIVTREYYMTNNIWWLTNKEKWAGLQSIGLEHKTIEKFNGEIITEDRYYIISFVNDINLFARAVREHWGVENGLHWHLDYTFKEDDNTTMEKDSLKNLGIIMKVVLGILKMVQYFYNKSLKKIRYLLSLNFEKEIETIFKLLNTEQLETLMQK